MRSRRSSLSVGGRDQDMPERKERLNALRFFAAHCKRLVQLVGGNGGVEMEERIANFVHELIHHDGRDLKERVNGRKNEKNKPPRSPTRRSGGSWRGCGCRRPVGSRLPCTERPL